MLSVISLVEKVYSANSQAERELSGRELQRAIGDFLKEFLHHMEEEEKVFIDTLFEERLIQKKVWLIRQKLDSSFLQVLPGVRSQ